MVIVSNGTVALFDTIANIIATTASVSVGRISEVAGRGFQRELGGVSLPWAKGAEDGQ